ncbi:hypothetical protein [Janthinobacterium sp. MDT1-19]|uniref:hypothetical protein n=1 Tax=Janthinobacterium sp. MDT1-19 TaxID=1259339 RepID=UPI003F2285E5
MIPYCAVHELANAGDNRRYWHIILNEFQGIDLNQQFYYSSAPGEKQGACINNVKSVVVGPRQHMAEHLPHNKTAFFSLCFNY